MHLFIHIYINTSSGDKSSCTCFKKERKISEKLETRFKNSQGGGLGKEQKDQIYCVNCDGEIESESINSNKYKESVDKNENVKSAFSNSSSMEMKSDLGGNDIDNDNEENDYDIYDEDDKFPASKIKFRTNSEYIKGKGKNSVEKSLSSSEEYDAKAQRVMVNFRELLWYWREYYLRRGRDRLSIEFSSHIHFYHWNLLVDKLCMDDGSSTSLVRSPISLPTSPYNRPSRFHSSTSIDLV
jgi:hypothetical protein